jgi:hypothetical protein
MRNTMARSPRLSVVPALVAPFTATVERVGPPEAEIMLAKNDMNRSLSAARLFKYQLLMSTGQWQENGQSIILASDGTLLDGQTRLRAIIESGETFWLVVVRGVSKDAFPTLDTGAVRKPKDVLSAHGYENPQNLGATAKIVLNYIHGAPPNTSRSAEEILNFVKAHPSIVMFTSLTKGLRGNAPANAVGAILFLSDEAGVYPGMAATFLEKVRRGVSLSLDDPCYQLRERLRGTKWRADDIVVLNMIRKAWNAFREERTLRFITEERLREFTPITARIKGFDAAAF